MAQSVKSLTLAFGSGHDLRIVGSSPTSEVCAGRGDCIQFSLPLPTPLKLN